MIRRGWWLAVGAALGVTGYRRASRLARTVFPPAPAALARPGGSRVPVITARGALAAAAAAGRGTVSGIAFARDVRAGVAEYLDRQGDETGRTLGSQQGRPASGTLPPPAGTQRPRGTRP